MITLIGAVVLVIAGGFIETKTDFIGTILAKIKY